MLIVLFRIAIVVLLEVCFGYGAAVGIVEAVVSKM